MRPSVRKIGISADGQFIALRDRGLQNIHEMISLANAEAILQLPQHL